MTLDIALLGVGIALLLAGGHALVSGAARLADSMGVSQVTIGMTVVAFGTSAPEFAVNTLAAIRGDAEIAFGNVIGSNIANLGLVMGVAAMVKPLRIEALIVSRELPIMLLATLSALIIGMDRIRGESEFYDRSDGLLLLLFFCVFLYQSTVGSESEPSDEPIRAEVSEQARTRTRNAVLRPGLTGAIGLGTLLLGAELTVMSAVSLAELMEVPPAIIGLTIVAVGTSLPELVTSVVATWRGQTDLAVANVVGSNIFNLLFILGSTAVMRPILVPVPGGGFDLLVLCGVSAVVLLLSRTGSSTVVRWHGATLLVAYLVYVTFRIAA